MDLAEKTRKILDNLPENYASLKNKLFLKLSNREQQEILSGTKPLILTDVRKKEMLCIINGQERRLGVILGANGSVDGTKRSSYSSGDKKTPLG